ncbi:response regulator [Glaciecola siphonariae]|uniref:histidine kinase n=1 Tax=Glaciecola siphonariae TaxID=521012 RepID=A0ABV9M203_9ALTE
MLHTTNAARPSQIGSTSFITVFVLVIVFIVLAMFATAFALKQVKQQVLSDYGDSLEVVLDTTENAVLQWVGRQQSALTQISLSDSFARLNSSIIAEHVNRQQSSSSYQSGSEVMSRIKDELVLLQGIKNNQGFLVLSAQGQVIVSTDEQLIPQDFNIRQEHDQAFTRALSTTTLIPPIKLQHHNTAQRSILLITAPVRVNGEVLAVLAGIYFAHQELSDIALLGRIGESGETYLFDRKGIMSTDSRFNSTLEKISLIEPAQSAIMNIRLYDPGVNLIYNTDAERAMDRLTLMARSAIAGQSAKNTQGYRDYRGVTVIGAWRWSDALNMGITTEIDLEEALSSYYSARTVIIILLLACLSVVLILAAFLFSKLSRANRKLSQAARTLEDQVKERTAQLERAMQELRDEQAVLQGLFDAIPDPIFCKDNEKRYIKGNHAFFDIFDKAPEEVIGRTDKEITHQQDQDIFSQTDDEVLRSGKPLVMERVGNHEDGTNRVFETKKSLLPFADKKAPGILGISRDITAQRKNEDRLIQASIDAQAANKAKSEFLARMSHEIRTPMNGVLGMLDLVLASSLTADQSNKLNVAKTSAASLLGIINDILDFSRVEAGKMELEQLDFSPIQQLEDAAKALAIKAEEKSLELLVDVTKIEHAMLIGDPMRLRQIVTNLLNNAIKFTAEGQVVLRAETQLDSDGSIKLTCAVSDSGIGIPSEKLKGLFESFSQVDSSTTRVYGGSGLGLAISKRLCELMGGSISVSSELGQGSCFEFSVRCMPSSLKPQKLPDLDLSNWHVLIVDDNQTNLDILSNQLAKMGISSHSAISAKSALFEIEHTERAFDLVITDMNMPVMDGLALTRTLRQRPDTDHIKILMLSSMSFNVSSSELNEMGLDGCLLKPVSTIDLFNTIKLVAGNDPQSKRSHAITEQSLVGLSAKLPAKEDTWPDYHRILIVEDNAVNRMVAEGLMQQFSLRYSLAEDGQQAIDTLLNSPDDQPFTLVLMDCQMPVLDGYSATRKIRSAAASERYSNIPIIAMTANALKGDREKCLEAGMNDHVPKPIDTGTLKKALIEGFAQCPAHLTGYTMRSDDTAGAQQKADQTMQMGINMPQAPLLTMNWDENPPSLAAQPDFYVKSLALYIKQYEHFSFANNEANNKIEAANAPDTQLRQDIHTLKGGSGNLGFVKLFSACIEIEKRLEDGVSNDADLAQIDYLLSSSVHDAKAMLEVNIRSVQNASEQDTKRSQSDILLDIEAYTNNNELVPFALLNELKTIASNKPDDLQLKNMIDALEHFDYSSFTTILGSSK